MQVLRAVGVGVGLADRLGHARRDDDDDDPPPAPVAARLPKPVPLVDGVGLVPAA